MTPRKKLRIERKSATTDQPSNSIDIFKKKFSMFLLSKGKFEIKPRIK